MWRVKPWLLNNFDDTAAGEARWTPLGPLGPGGVACMGRSDE
jgi:hypothetical protein